MKRRIIANKANSADTYSRFAPYGSAYLRRYVPNRGAYSDRP